MEQDRIKQINSLIIKTGKGDEEAFNLLYQKMGALMLRVAMGICSSRAIAEEVVQESCIRIVRFADRFKRAENGSAWICRIVKNCALSTIKTQKNHCDIDEFYNIEDITQSEQKTAVQVEVKLALEKLDGTQRKLIWLKYFCDMTVRDIAEEIGQPKSTVAYNLQKAEEQLKKLLTG